MEWTELVEPAVTLAREGFVVDEYLSESLKEEQRNMERFPEFERVYCKEDGSCYEPGKTMILSDLAWTLDQVRDKGAAGFYRGEVAKRLVEDLQRNGGIITLENLSEYNAPIREPIHGIYRGYDVYGMPPPSSGGNDCRADPQYARELRPRRRGTPIRGDDSLAGRSDVYWVLQQGEVSR